MVTKSAVVTGILRCPGASKRGNEGDDKLRSARPRPPLFLTSRFARYKARKQERCRKSSIDRQACSS